MTSKFNHPRTALIAGLAAGLLSQMSMAAEEIVVYGDKAVAAVQARAAQFQTETKDYAQSLNENVKATLDKELKQIAMPKLELAVGEVSTRG